MITPDQLVNEARGWLNTPFHHQGRAKGRGVDCIGLPIGCLKELGVVTYNPDGYAREPDGTMEKYLSANLEEIPMQAGALLLFKIRTNPQHIAIATDYGMIHSFSGGAKKVIEHRIDEWWAKRLLKIYALPGVDYVRT